jgi:thiol-disulfide isomerase/thioredoxin
MKRFVVYGLIVVGVLGAVSYMRSRPLGPAKPLSIEQWVKGGPVNLAEGKGKTVYLVEFWATWCPPCGESVPHLSEIQQKYKDKGLVVVGVSSEGAEEVKAFVNEMGSNMNYVVAVDQNEQTTMDYMEANWINTIPHAFLVDANGMIVWHGSPLDDDMEQALAKLLEPTAPPPPLFKI